MAKTGERSKSDKNLPTQKIATINLHKRLHGVCVAPGARRAPARERAPLATRRALVTRSSARADSRRWRRPDRA